MRLINTRTLKLQDFGLNTIPTYAILSHTWGDEEVSFQDMSLPSVSCKKGYRKIEKTCQLAMEQQLDYAWVDTCCIDKSSSAELTESINSMFQWYGNAAVCYVFLEDLPPGGSGEGELRRCRWFTRGWTLQELLAPVDVSFYDSTWEYRGSKLFFIDTISAITKIHKSVLRDRTSVADVPVAVKMSWAASRQTTRVEDQGYCLLGIFDLNMPLIYGEGSKAFRRLQEEIIKRNNDLTIFAWQTPRWNAIGAVEFASYQSLSPLLAPAPIAFKDSSGIKPFSDDFINFSISNKGLLISGDAPLRITHFKTRNGDDVPQYALFLGSRRTLDGESHMGGIYLRKIAPNLFYRDGRRVLAGFGDGEVEQDGFVDATDYCILIDPGPAQTIEASATFRRHAIHIPLSDKYSLKDAVPEELWDITDRLFLRPKPYNWVRYPMVIAMSFDIPVIDHMVGIVAFCDYRDHGRLKIAPICKVAERGRMLREGVRLFHGRNRAKSIDWTEQARIRKFSISTTGLI